MTANSAVYNEIDPFACEWLRRLCDAGEIRSGRVIEGDIRDIVDVSPGGRAHFFAGIGLWDYALSLAGWPDDIDVWTGSCPCQPFSVAGRGRGADDPRHLWPAWFRLVRQCRPSVVFGEQVAGVAGWAWFDALSADMEDCGYAVGASELCAAGLGAPHARHRLYWCAVADGYRPRLALRRGGSRDDGEGRSTAQRGGSQSSPVGATSPVDHAGSERRDGIGVCLQPRGPQQADVETAGAGATRGFWAGAEWIECTDGKLRAAQPGTFPLAYGRAGQVAALRPGGDVHWYRRAPALKCIGNAIVPQVAAAFVGLMMERLGLGGDE